jgi:alkylation response protein AidB-like acyl-CoA dehydrogenase
MMVAPLLVEMGSDEQREKWLPGIVDGSEIWCQLFSEPDAGSDLAGARTTAVRDGDLWRVNGQKVWTSGGHYAKWAILVARTDPAAPKHSGLSFFGIDMRQDGIQPKPLVQMNGSAEFNEVFLDDATTAHSHLIGEEGKGWPVALRTLSYERESLDADAEPGIQTDLDLSIAAGRYASGEIADGSEGFMPGGLEAWELLCSVIAANGQQTDPRIRDRAVKIYTGIKTSSWMSQRFSQAPEVGAEVSLGKLAATQLMRDWRDLALTALGPNGQLLDGEGTFDGVPAQIALSVPGLSIAGGTDEIQRNIVGERVLGLPREPRPSNE